MFLETANEHKSVLPAISQKSPIAPRARKRVAHFETSQTLRSRPDAVESKGAHSPLAPPPARNRSILRTGNKRFEGFDRDSNRRSYPDALELATIDQRVDDGLGDIMRQRSAPLAHHAESKR